MPQQHAARLANAASAISADMLARCSAAASDARVTMSVDEFRQIARLLGHAANAVRRDEGGLDADGFRFWLPLPQIEAQQRELRELRAQASRAPAFAADTFQF